MRKILLALALCFPLAAAPQIQIPDEVRAHFHQWMGDQPPWVWYLRDRYGNYYTQDTSIAWIAWRRAWELYTTGKVTIPKPPFPPEVIQEPPAVPVQRLEIRRIDPPFVPPKEPPE